MKYLKSLLEFLEIQIANENVGYVKPSISGETKLIEDEDLDTSEENSNEDDEIDN